MKIPFKEACRHGLALLLTLLAAATGYAQTSEKPPVAPPLWKIDPLGQGVIFAPGCAPYQDENGPLLIGNPLLDGPPGTPGWVAGVDVGVIVPHIKNHLFASVTRASGATDVVHLPTADLGVRAMPKFELGYRCGQAAGEIIVAYRFLAAHGDQFVSPVDLPPFGPTGTPLTSRLDLQVIDVDYGSYEPRTILGWDMKWRAGVRGMIFYADSQANNGTLAQQTVNRYWGLGPHGSVDFRRGIGDTGLALFGRIDGSLMFGRVAQRYIDTAIAADGTTDSGETRLFLNGMITDIAVEAGLAWTPRWSDRFHVTAGYYYEHFFHLGASAVPVSARQDLGIQGGFIRAEWNY